MKTEINAISFVFISDQKIKRGIKYFILYRREEISNEIANGMPIWTAPPKSLFAKEKQSPSDRTHLKGEGNSSSKKDKKNITQQQIEGLIEGWINYFRTASEQQTHQAIQSQKFQALPLEIKEGILNRGEELKLNLVAEKIKKVLEK